MAQLAVCAAGTGTVVLTGLVARRLGGNRVGIAAAAVAAVYPMLVVADGTLMSETLFTFLAMLSVVAAYRVLDRPTAARWCVLGAALGLAVMTRGEGVLLLPLLVVPIAWRTRAEGGRRSVRGALAVVLVAVALLIPWTIRNVATFHRPVLLANDSGTLLRGANCDVTYHGEMLGYWSFFCDAAPGVRWSDNEAIHNQRLLRSGFSYVRHHSTRLPVVVAARLGRTFGVYRPVQQVDLGREEGRPYGMALAGWLTYLALLPFAVIGSVHLVRRRDLVSPLAAVVAMVVITSVVTYGNTRFRTVMEPVVVIVAVVGVTTVASTVRARRAAPMVNPDAGPRREAVDGARTS